MQKITSLKFLPFSQTYLQPFFENPHQSFKECFCLFDQSGLELQFFELYEIYPLRALKENKAKQIHLY